MGNGEKIRHIEEDGSVKEYTVVEPFDIERARRAQQAEIKKREALARGVEPFNVDEALKYYYPDELTGDENRIRNIVANLESEYYGSGFSTLKEWAEDKEKYDINKDATGND